MGAVGVADLGVECVELRVGGVEGRLAGCGQVFPFGGHRVAEHGGEIRL